jgi:hypothetical protein
VTTGARVGAGAHFGSVDPGPQGSGGRYVGACVVGGFTGGLGIAGCTGLGGSGFG